LILIITYLIITGEVQIDQAHRGYYSGNDISYSSINPLYMKYTPDSDGYYSGQNGYGYKSLEEFVIASSKLRNKTVTDPRYIASQSLSYYYYCKNNILKIFFL
jgi:hypothetical protein